MSAFADWLTMGGYAGYVWPAYALATAVLGGLSLYYWSRHRRSAADLDRLQGSIGPRR
jgi:heme exporter protein D